MKKKSQRAPAMRKTKNQPWACQLSCPSDLRQKNDAHFIKHASFSIRFYLPKSLISSIQKLK